MSDFSEEYEMIKELASSDIPTDEGMLQLIEYGKQTYPGEIWEKAAAIDYGADADKITFWLSETLNSRTWPENIEALWFAICNPSCANTYDLKLIGSECFITESDGFFEDIIFSESYIPKEQYARSTALKELYRLTAGIFQFSEAAEYILSLGFAALSISEACRRAEVLSMPGKNGILHIAAGFESGDLMLLKSLERQQTV